jgi:hypothetical protein
MWLVADKPKPVTSRKNVYDRKFFSPESFLFYIFCGQQKHISNDPTFFAQSWCICGTLERRNSAHAHMVDKDAPLSWRTVIVVVTA